jgi:ribosomal protein L7Ae-like RNA K-turn-binding protein
VAEADAALRLLGLAARAGAVLTGTERVREAVRADGVLFVIVAADASANSLDKLVPLLVSRRVPHVVVLDRAALGGAVGRSELSAIGLTDRSFAGRIEELLVQGSGSARSQSRASS